MSLLAAAITAALFATFGFPFRYYQCWSSWGGWRAWVLALGYFVIVGLGSGFLGWLFAQLTHAQPTDILVVNGVLYGAAGALAVRADFQSHHRSASPFPATAGGYHRATSSVLALSVKWLESALDDVAEQRIKSWHQELDDEALINQAYDIYMQTKQRKDTPALARKTALKLLVEAIELLRSSIEQTRLEGRWELITYGTKYTINEHEPRPGTTKSKPTPLADAPPTAA